MNHLLICREFPPAPSGGIGVYAQQLSRLLAETGDTVHVIGQLWEKSKTGPERCCDGKLIVHRAAYEDGASLWPRRPHPLLKAESERRLFASACPALSFSWQAARIAERLVDEEGVDVIEAQEFEAPLFCFQVRRALGLGPKRRPPCLVHLHSPTEFIARHNGWDVEDPAVAVAKRLEDYSIAEADALLCPSEYLARRAESHYGLEPQSIEVIPLPLGDCRVVCRREETWANGTICYAGRLEPRKGVLEWTDAAVLVAREFPSARFDFIGADTIHQGTSVRAALQQRIPRDLRPRFRFRGQRPRRTLSRCLAEARLAVVPSRWENFPFACIEAMASGLPVIASREGGMVEMIEDGRTGWLAEAPTADKLAAALRRALATPAPRLAAMGEAATTAIARLCGNEAVVASHQTIRRHLAARQSGDNPAAGARLLAEFPEFAGRQDDGLAALLELVRSDSDISRASARADRWRLARATAASPSAAARQICGRLRNKLARFAGDLRRTVGIESN